MPSTTTTLRARIPWQDDSELVDSHARRYMGVALYQSRLRLLAPPTTRGSLLALECSRTLGRMLQGKERIYDVHSTRAAQRDSTRFVSERDMLRTMDALAQRALDQAGAALQQMPTLRERFGGWFLLLERWSALDNLDALLDSLGQFSHPYLLWVEQVRQASAPTQRALRAYLDSEFHLNAIAHNPEVLQAVEPAGEPPREVADARRQFDLVRNNMSAAVRRLVELRSQGFEATRFAFEESRVGRGNDTRPYAAWPFPLRLTGVEEGETLAAAVASYQVLGAWMAGCGANLRFVESASTGQAAARRRPADSAGEQAAQALWRAVHEAGEALAWLGAALHALVRVEASAHCQQCFRHVGLRFRKYCELHARPDDGATLQYRPATDAATASNTAAAPTVHARTRHRHSTLLAAEFRAQFERLDAELARKPVWRAPTRALERALARSRSRAGRKPQALGSSGAERADDIVVLVDALRPVLGEPLYQRMQALQGALAAWAGADSQEAVQRAESLTPGGFFAHWFSGFSQTVGRKQLRHVGTDPTHPMTAWKLVASGQYNTPLRRLSPLNFDSIVRDLLLHRAWLEVGGEQADAALRQGGAPLPGLKPPSRVDLVAARQMREVQGLSFEAIGKTFGVSRAAVYLALKRAG
jgi:hypothetical protein